MTFQGTFEGWFPAVTAAAVVILLMLSAFFSGSETALFSLNAVDREALRNGGKAEALERLLAHPRRVLASVLFGNELVNVSLSTLCAAMVLHVAPEKPWLNLFVATPLLLVAGEVIPKSFALRFSRRAALLVARPLTVWAFAITPLRALLTWIADHMVRAMGGGQEKNDGLQEAELLQLIDEGRRTGSIGKMEQEMIEAVFEFSDTPVSKIATPRPDIIAVRLTIPFSQLVALLREHRLSRIPVYQGRRDNVIGILLAKDLLRYKGARSPGPRELRALLVEPYFVPTSKPASELLRELQIARSHMALVVDEHGSIDGLVTMDDLLSELVGELLDEHDDDSEEISRILPNVWTVAGSMDCDDFTQETGIELPTGDYHTVAGFVFSEFGHLPAVGEALEREGVEFLVTELDERRITELTVRLADKGSRRPEPSPAKEL
jgi:CBS domain containing-hemolysin-like protein